MWYTSAGLALLLMLAVLVLPVPRVRRWLLTALARLGQAIVLAFLGACGTFFVQPHSAPAWLNSAANSVFEHSLGMPWEASASLMWLALAVGAVGVSLPILIVVELAVTMSTQAALVQSLRKEIRHASSWFDSRLAALGVAGPSYYSPIPHEVAAANEALQSVGKTSKSSAPATLVIDLLK